MYDSNYALCRQLDDFLAVVVIDGKNVFLDPGQKLCPYGMRCLETHPGATGFLLKPRREPSRPARREATTKPRCSIAWPTSRSMQRAM